MELCCSVNGDRRCSKCRKSYCEEHSYALGSWVETYMCHPCYDIHVRKPFIETPRSGMTFSELYLAVRKITPNGYISIEAKIQDHRPGVVIPELQWSVYHEKLTHSVGKTPEEVLAKYKTAWANYADTSSPLSNVNV